MTKTTMLCGAALLALTAVPAQSATPAAMIDDALSAAPAAVAAGATVITGGGKVLRQGTNGWTCMPDDPSTPGPDPMCVDKNGLAWAMAMMDHKAPAAGAIGMAYMLKGGSDASNTDPYAKGSADHWITTGPHVMILSADVARASGYPGGEHPDTAKPSVMFEGTPYAHIMLPVK
jgi:hypothetical protein